MSPPQSRANPHESSLLANVTNITKHDRGYDSEWDKKRLRILARDHGLCQVCSADGRVSLAREVDHRIPKAEGGTGDDSNQQSICRACHANKTQAESKRGIDRWARYISGRFAYRTEVKVRLFHAGDRGRGGTHSFSRQSSQTFKGPTNGNFHRCNYHFSSQSNGR